jgi:hypothetical protein
LKFLGKSLSALAFAGMAGLGMSAACHAGPYVVVKGGTTQWEDFEGDDKDSFTALGVGFNAGKYLSIELAYNDLGEVTGDEAGDIKAEAYSTSVAGYIHWPMFEHFGWFLKFGLESWKADLDLGDESDRVTGTGSFAGAGAKASFGLVDVTVFYELHKLDEQGQRSDAAELYDDFDLDIVGAGVAYRF